MKTRSLIPLLTAALLVACASVTNPVTGQRELTVMDEKSEIAEGGKGHQEVIKEYGVVRCRVAGLRRRLGQRLAAASHRAKLQWTFTVLDSPEVNAFALPGGYVYVTRGIMAYMDSEADLAGVLGHEIGHVTARHGAQRATRQATGRRRRLATIGGALWRWPSACPAWRRLQARGPGRAAGLITSYSRDQELPADPWAPSTWCAAATTRPTWSR